MPKDAISYLAPDELGMVNMPVLTEENIGNADEQKLHEEKMQRTGKLKDDMNQILESQPNESDLSATQQEELEGLRSRMTSESIAVMAEINPELRGDKKEELDGNKFISILSRYLFNKGKYLSLKNIKIFCDGQQHGAWFPEVIQEAINHFDESAELFERDPDNKTVLPGEVKGTPIEDNQDLYDRLKAQII